MALGLCRPQMKKYVFLVSAAALSSLSLAQEVATVLSATPVLQSVAVPRRVCTTVQVEVQQPKSGVGAAVGAMAGAVLGSTVGHGPSQGAATVAGAVTGSVLGDHLEGSGATQTRDVQQCRTQMVYENRTVAYNVVYEFSGRQYTVQMPQDPGPTLQLQLTPVGLPATAVVAAAPEPQVVYEPPVVLIAAPPVYYPRPYGRFPFPLEFGWWGEGGGRHPH